MYLQNNAVDFAIIDDDMVLIQDLNLHFKNSDQVNLKWAGDDYLHFLEHAAHKVDIVLLDIMLGEKSGIELIEPIKTKNEKIQIIMFSVLEDNNILLDCIKRGADGYLLKDTSPDLIISSILDTNRGGANLSPLMARKLFDYFSHPKLEDIKWSGLTDAEFQVLKLLSDGYSYKIIGDKLDMTLDSVRYYIKALYKKLHVNSKGEAIKLFLTS